MTPDLTYLVWAVALAILQVLVSVVGAMTQFPLPVLVGNREPAVEGRGWVGRAQRAHRNMIENLVLFAALVLVAHVSGLANATTATGAAVFFYARLVYVPVYIVGIPWLRTLVWTASAVGLLMILSQLL
jgi:uncharacterized MAPEG superfamily protein